MKIILASCLFLLLSGCSLTTHDDGSENKIDHLRIANIYNLGPIHPILSINGMSSNLRELVSDPLYDDRLHKNRLAEWISSEDAKLWKVRLRSNVKFHDGSVLQASDVAQNIEMLRRVASDFYEDRFNTVKEVKVLSPLDLSIELDQPNVYFKNYLSFGVIPARYAANASTSQRMFTERPIGTGPFRLIRSDASSAYFERFEDYYNGLSSLKSISVVPMNSKEAAWVALVRGEIDFFYDPFSEGSFVTSLHNTFRNHEVKPRYAYGLGFSNKDPILRNKDVRKALSYSIRRRDLFELSQPPLEAKTIWIDDPRVHAPQPELYDVARARSILDHAGWLQKNGALLRIRNGHPFRFPLRYLSGDDLSFRIARLLARDFLDVGVEAVLTPVAMERAYEHVKMEKTGGLIFFTVRSNDPDALLRYFFYTPRKLRSSGEANWMEYEDEVLNHLLDESRRVVNEDARNQLYSQALERISENSPALFLFFRTWNVPLRNCWRNVDLVSGSILESLWRWRCDE